ncbi:hypothetical protein GCM10010517_38350 [Streptosporangium fragile]|uniref:Uncharacterized protein n=1 Tax=Streptosporangium fragile TaxID=46186 RepID=A0ABN3W1D5_9ACTN
MTCAGKMDTAVSWWSGEKPSDHERVRRGGGSRKRTARTADHPAAPLTAVSGAARGRRRDAAPVRRAEGVRHSAW